ncbi:hypothetical protein V8E51_009617, partial [Hyaloscypha variabilis]
TFKHYIIVNSFKELGIWPLSFKTGIKKIRLYNKRKRLANNLDKEEDYIELPILPLSSPKAI